MPKITVKETFVYGCHGEIIDESIKTFFSKEEFEKYEKDLAYRLGWEGCNMPTFEIIKEGTEKTNGSNKI